MKHVLKIIVPVLTFAFLWAGCNSDSAVDSPPAAGTGSISGKVTDALTGEALAGVAIQAQGADPSNSKSGTTDVQGIYRLDFSVDSSSSVLLSFSKASYRDTILVGNIKSGVLTPLNVKMSPRSVVSTGGGGTGIAQTITFLGASPQEISVYGVGAEETSILGWEVRDSVGAAVDSAHAVNLTFVINGAIGGGEYISPVTVRTNSAGQAFTTFNSGIRSGVAQIIATATVGARTLTSSPVRLIIRAGFPDQNHFTVGPERRNFPALDVFGKTDAISVLVGDIYSNPVTQNTAVYLATRAGVIVASIFTSETGQGSANLISGNPLPMGANALTTFGNGYHYVIASTIGQGGAIVKDSALILWSGFSQISNINPSSINITNGGGQVFSFNVSDANGNPLSSGTTISVSATGAQAEVSFGNNGTISLNDILFGGTSYAFSLVDSQPGMDSVSTASVSISVTSQNGNVAASIGGTIR